MKRFFIIVVSSLLLSGVALADAAEADKPLNVRTFQLKHKSPDRAAALIRPLMSTEGSISIQPATNAFVVNDHPDNLKAIAAALSAFDVPTKTFRVSVRLVSAGFAAAAPAPKPEMKEIAGKLAMLRYNSVEDLGQAVIEGEEGEPGAVELQGGYRADFKFGEFDPTTNSIKLNDFKLSRLQRDQLVQLYKASLNLKIGQTLMFGATKTQGQRAVFLVFVAHP